jgi:4a-hydroxytetrahydrobiopterin dehydratase
VVPRPPALTSGELDRFLASSPDWTIEDGRLVRRATAPSFAEAIRWVVAVADAAERADHHPDIDIRWRTITFRLSTHDAGAVTILDVSLAHDIDAIVQESS